LLPWLLFLPCEQLAVEYGVPKYYRRIRNTVTNSIAETMTTNRFTMHPLLRVDSPPQYQGSVYQYRFHSHFFLCIRRPLSRISAARLVRGRSLCRPSCLSPSPSRR